MKRQFIKKWYKKHERLVNRGVMSDISLIVVVSYIGISH